MKRFLAALFFFNSILLHAENKTAGSIAELNSFASQAKAGDHVFLKAGIYKDAVISFHNVNATVDAPITITADSNVFLQGNSSISFSGNYLHIENFVFRNGGNQLNSKQVIAFRTSEKDQAYHSTVSGCVIDTYNNDIKTDVNTWVGIYGEYNKVEHCLFKTKDNMGPTLVVWLENGKPAHHTISDNYFLGRKNGANVDNGLESIRIGDSKTSFTDAHCVIAFNRFEECDGEIEIISNKSCHNSYFHNTFINCDGGLTLRHGNHTLCDGNYFDGKNKKLSYGIRFIGEGHVAINNYFTNLHGAPNEQYRSPVSVLNGLVNTPINGYYRVKNAVITDNIFMNCDAPLIRIGAFSPKREGMTEAPDSVTVKHNYFYNQRSTVDPFQIITPPSHLIVMDNKVASSWALPPSIERKVMLTDNKGAGADTVDPFISKRMEGKKYTQVNISMVGPEWIRGND